MTSSMPVLGNRRLLETDLAVILNSSQSKTPCGNDHWVIATSKAIPDLIQSGHTIVTSLGLLTWELLIHLVSINRGNQVIIAIDWRKNNPAGIFRDTVGTFCLDENRTAMIFLDTATNMRSTKAGWPERDRFAVDLARRVFPVSIRRKGRLHGLLSGASDSSKIDSRYQMEYERPLVEPPRYVTGAWGGSFTEWDSVTHWTKTCHGPWPGENRFEYCQRLLESEGRYPNDAFNTLLRIISEMKIRASSLRIRERKPAIGFTEASPAKSLQLLRWCPRRVNWNFEPYGVAIRRESAMQSGVRPVIYGDDREYRKLPEPHKPYFQSKGKLAVDWSREQEWRHIDDLDLRQFRDDDIIYLVRRQAEATMLKGRVKSAAYALSAE